MVNDPNKLDPMEKLKEESRFLRGTIVEGLQDPITASISEDDTKLLKFHGSYQQDDRDIRDERRKQKLEPAYQFMLRVAIPGGVATPKQWLATDDLAQKYGDQTIKLTTRQAFQLHGILKWNLKDTIKTINEALMTTIAACGDVNRNVMCNPNPYQSEIHQEIQDWAQKISDHLSPKTGAYHEIWLDQEKIIDSKEEEEPIYGKTYLPRKFKIGIAAPPSNDVDVFSQDIGLIAIIENDQVQGFNVVVGGGMGSTHGNTNTYPQLGKIAGYCAKEDVVDVAEKIVTIQRDYGNRSDRKNARFKYTIDRYGLDWFKQELAERLGWELEEAKDYHFDHNGDRYGWIKGSNRWHLTLFVENGRVKDADDYKLMTALREIAHIHTGDFRLTPNQNLVIANVTAPKKKKINEILDMYGIRDGKQYSGLRRNSIACVAMPTCGLAMAESERYLPSLIDKIEGLLAAEGLQDEEIVIRMSGCPNGCSRPALAEIAFIGKAPGKYNLYLGGSFIGDRLNQLYRENIDEEEILATLKEIFHDFAQNRTDKEHFGDFVVRKGYVDEVYDGQNFHRDMKGVL
ncbi:assimilatory sulfite reductase (NADPH) hemoprotein subunit [Gracilibacillus thailandensis]|uniref:Sulfite reductase [NADPH] hemoprotein beta-component n=1 Tax=Gracilibacillus thailandensis TaxID=563735 RepID=A0A6N7QS80_9BACI|nr:assimilatory sulfite reductase (NADPH) hemoprotein subunit [Gracilibacillus thailandensis]MRI64858.1 assimilatory sulfite reductase (NADPH) hemoprotein subunit [Gracilibacillus thailandensis]